MGVMDCRLEQLSDLIAAGTSILLGICLKGRLDPAARLIEGPGRRPVEGGGRRLMVGHSVAPSRAMRSRSASGTTEHPAILRMRSLPAFSSR